MKPLPATLITLAALAWTGATMARPPLEVVDSVDLERFQGRWYEIALLPNFFQRRCVAGTNANYGLLPDGTIQVVNRCQRRDGQWLGVQGVARLADADGPTSRLEVRFAPRWLAFLPFVWGDYNVLALGENYDYALVGSDNRRYLWILSREPELADSTYQRLRAEAERQGFPVERLERTPQPGDA